MSYNPNNASAAPTPTVQLPSATDLETVSAIPTVPSAAPNHQASAPASSPSPVSTILQPILNSCSAQWHIDFLFTPDPIHVTHLDANISNRALLSRVNVTRAASPVLHPSPVPLASHNDHVQAYFLFVPVFTVDYVTVGVGVVSGTASENISWLSESQRSPTNNFHLNCRFLINARTGVIIVVHDAPDDNMIMLDMSRYYANTSYRQHKAFFNRSTFLPVVRNATSPLYAGDLVHSLLAFEDEFLPCNCPVCGAPPPTLCDCSLVPPRAANPFDFDHMVKAVSSFIGNFEGVVVKSLDPVHNPSLQVVLGIRSCVSAHSDAQIVLQMRDWSLSDYAWRAASDSSPRTSARMIVAPPDMQGQLGIGRAHCAGCPCSAMAESARGCNVVGTAQTLMSTRDHLSGDGAAGAMMPGVKTNGVREDNNGYNLSVLASNAVPAGLCNGSGSGSGTHPGNAVCDKKEAQYVLSDGQSATRPDTSLEDNTGADGGGGAGGAGDSAHDETRKQEMLRSRLAEMMRQQKDDVRKQRNREAAKRSNMKKKLQRESLEASLRSLKIRMGELRRRELELRHENRRLRKLKERLPP